MESSRVILLLIGIYCVILVRHAEAVCCRPMIDEKCRDGTKPTFYCGYGKCNIFGCNCAGGCRYSKEYMYVYEFNDIKPITEN